MKKYNISTNLIQVIKNLFNRATSAVLFSSSIGDWFRTAVGVRQGCLLSPTHFNIFLERIMTDALEDRRETQTAVVWSCFPFIRSGQNHLARHSERGKRTRRTKEEVGRQHQEMDRPGVRQVPEGSGGQGKMEKTGCEIICGAPTTLAVKG